MVVYRIKTVFRTRDVIETQKQNKHKVKITKLKYIMLEIILPSIIGSMIGLGVCGYVRTFNNEQEIADLKCRVESLNTIIPKKVFG